MRHKLGALGSVILMTSTVQILGQASFINLDFESAALPLSPAGEVSIVSVTSALPGWRVFVAGAEQQDAFYNAILAGGSFAGVLNYNADFQARALDGNFSLILHHGGGPDFSVASLSQTGVVPADAVSIQAQIAEGLSGLFRLSLNGVQIPMVPIGAGSNYTVYGGDVSAFAGQSAELSISLLRGPNGGGHTTAFDSIRFSPVPVPEPHLVLLLALGGMMAGGWRWNRLRIPTNH